jgi:hypothetical protein
VTSLTATKTELTELGGSSQRAVRDVKREPSGTLDDLTLNENWYLYGKGDFVSREAWSLEDKCWKVQPFHSIQAKGVAYRKKYFGEGAERIVAKFREVDSVGNFVGPLLVSKESRFQSDARYSDQKAFHKVFCQTQGTAKLLAEEFNKKLSSIPGVSSLTPRIEFIDCSVYTVRDTGLGEIGVLVEKQLNTTEYKKWNDNKGGIEGRSVVDSPNNKPLVDLSAIPESDEEDSDLEGDADSETNPTRARIVIHDADIPQAFSHFTYYRKKRKMLVCDLQGVLTRSALKSKFELTDPVIHYRSSKGRKCVFGRTDRGADGVDDFFKSHVCSELCRMMKRKWVAEEKR